MECIDEIRKNGCYDCADKVDLEDGYCQTYKAYNQALEDLQKMIDYEYYDGDYGDYHEVEMITRMIEKLKK